jgi:hypothetical protein
MLARPKDPPTRPVPTSKRSRVPLASALDRGPREQEEDVNPYQPSANEATVSQKMNRLMREAAEHRTARDAAHMRRRTSFNVIVRNSLSSLLTILRR